MSDEETVETAIDEGQEVKARVLVVDDDRRIRRQVVSALRREGFDVIDAADGPPALEMAENQPPDIAIVDLHMPMSGIEVVKRLKAMHGNALHVAVLSGRDDNETRIEAFDAGADDFIPKPVFMPELQKRISAASRAQSAFVEARMARERADRLLAYSSEATALLAHDLNNGLAIAVGNVSFLVATATVNEDEKDALQATLRALKRMAGLVSNFVDIARLEDEALEPKLEDITIAELFEEVAAIHSSQIRDVATCAVSCDPGLRARFDRALVERVLHNLYGNATRYVNRGGVIRLGAEVSETDDGKWITLTVGNSGPEIPEEIRNNLFRKYARGGTKGQRGMGLYFCRLVCEAHRGTISVDNGHDGPEFKIHLRSL